MKVLVIISHPREDSMTSQIKDNFEKGLKEAGHEVDTLDLYKIGWSPVLYHEDEPDYSSKGNQHYSEDVRNEQARLLQYDAITFVFPIYWWSMPAMVKGYLDRVFNYKFAYGSGATLKNKVKKLLWLLLLGSSEGVLRGTNFGGMLEQLCNDGVAAYCGIRDSKVVTFCDVMVPTKKEVKALCDKAYKEGLNFSKP